LGYEGDGFAVFRDFKIGNVGSVTKDLSFLDLIKPGSVSILKEIRVLESYRSSSETMLVFPQPTHV